MAQGSNRAARAKASQTAAMASTPKRRRAPEGVLEGCYGGPFWPTGTQVYRGGLMTDASAV